MPGIDNNSPLRLAIVNIKETGFSFKPDLRDYGMGAQIIRDLGFNNFNLITNNPKKIVGLNGYGLTVHDIVKIPPYINDYNKKYMETKKEKMHHMI